MTHSSTRISVLGGLFLGGLCVLLLHLWILMVHDQPVWARRSYENRWAFRSVPSKRGPLLDRSGALLAYDESTTEVSVYYARFRLYHVVGAAVHGATMLAALRPGLEGRRYSYRPGVVGPRVAVRDLLAMPVRALGDGSLGKTERGLLMRYATTVLAVCSDLSRSDVYTAMREAAEAGDRRGLGDVLPVPRATLEERFAERLADLYALDRALAQEERRRVEDESGGLQGARPRRIATLVATLELQRERSLEQKRLVRVDDDGVEHEGVLLEDLRRTFAHDVPFDLSAPLRVDPDRHPGIDVAPAVRRVCVAPVGTSLRELIGEVRSIDRLRQRIDEVAPPPDDDEAAADGDEVAAGDAGAKSGRLVDPWLERYFVEKSEQADWLSQLVPDDLDVDDETRDAMRKKARQRFEFDMMLRERRGTGGFELGFNDTLMGELGMRFVEHDNQRREHLLWSHLRVASGEPQQVTLDVRLQGICEEELARVVAQARAELGADASQRDVERCVGALVLLDAQSGDVLAFAGAPVTWADGLGADGRPNVWLRRLPGISWAGNGSIGSVAKPFVLVEHLRQQRLGGPHCADVKQCGEDLGRFGGRRLSCLNHWAEGASPISALAKSCNSFFFQVGIGLGADGVHRAFEGFGLLKAREHAQVEWQAGVPGMGAVPGALDPTQLLPFRAIGYGVQVSPVYVARAYAALATGVLPEVGIAFDRPRRGVPLVDLEPLLPTVRQGLREVVDYGSAKGIFPDHLLVHGKTGTAEVSEQDHNNAWFAGYLPQVSVAGHQLAFTAVVYRVSDGEHGAEVAGRMIADVLARIEADPELRWTYLGGG